MNKSERNEYMRNMLMMRPDLEEVRAKLKASPEDSMLWYQLGMALCNNNLFEDGINAFSRAICLEPFNAYYHFGRGRRLAAIGQFWQGMADLTLATRITPESWTFWYYCGTTRYLHGLKEESIEDFRKCAELAEPYERYPFVHWLYTISLCALGEKEKAVEALSLVPDDAVPPQMDYGYCRCVKLYKGLIKPESFIDIQDMQEKCLKHENRINLELNTMYYGLYAYALYINDNSLADYALKELMKIAIPTAFGYKRGVEAARKRGIIE